MSKTVYRTVLTFVRPDVTVDFFATTPVMESKKSEYRDSGKILGYYGANSDDGLSRTYTVDFIDVESKNEFRGLPEVDAVMQDLLQYNDDNAIVTSSEEVEVVTTQYDWLWYCLMI